MGTNRRFGHLEAIAIAVFAMSARLALAFVRPPQLTASFNFHFAGFLVHWVPKKKRPQLGGQSRGHIGDLCRGRPDTVSSG
jgi:hypothetical protein